MNYIKIEDYYYCAIIIVGGIVVNVDLIKKLNSNEKDTQNYYVRIRKKEGITDKVILNNAEVYYDGFKIYEVGSNICAFNKEMLLLNSTNLDSIKDDEKKILEELRKHFFGENFNINKITFKIGEYGKNNPNIKAEAFKKIKEVDKINFNDNDTYKDSKGEDVYSIIVNFKNNINIEYNLAKILFKDYVKGNSNVFSGVNFCVNGKLVNTDFNYIHEKINDLVNFYETTTKTELEKKYQHQYLLNTKNIGDIEVYPFEEEYYLHEKKGRVDCIFYSINFEQQINHIFFVEIKVDTGVIAGSNGIHKHMIDINTITKKDINKLVERINTRNEVLGNNQYKLSDNYEIHFIIVVGRSKECDLENSIKNLNNKSYIKKYVIDKISSFEIKKKIKPIWEHKKELEENKKVLDEKNIKVQLLIDEKLWNPKSSNHNFNFKSVDWLDKNE